MLVRGDPLGYLAERGAQRAAAGLRRQLAPRGADDRLLDLAGNDYLGLARHPRVVAAAVAAVTAYGTGATGSRLVTGSTDLHARLEAALAEHLAAEAALVFSSGYLANLAAVCLLAGRGDLVVSDAGNHASLVDACRLSRARVQVVGHRDVAAVAAALAGRPEPRTVVVTDAVFSVDGDAAPLPELHRACRDAGAVLLVDEAHAVGVLGPAGRGAVAAVGLAGEPDVVRTATLSKALASQGGVLAGRADLVAAAVDTARPFLYDTALAPAAVAAAGAALRELTADPDLPGRARTAADALAAAARSAGFAAGAPAAAVVGLPVGEPGAALAAAAAAAAAGVRVGCFRAPSVPDGVSRLRLTARADLGPAELARAAEALAAARAAATAATTATAEG